MTERHPLKPFLPTGAKILMLGSFPPPMKRWKMPFYYPNFQNDMWRIFGIVFFNDINHLSTSTKSVLNNSKSLISLQIKASPYTIPLWKLSAATMMLRMPISTFWSGLTLPKFSRKFLTVK